MLSCEDHNDSYENIDLSPIKLNNGNIGLNMNHIQMDHLDCVSQAYVLGIKQSMDKRFKRFKYRLQSEHVYVILGTLALNIIIGLIIHVFMRIPCASALIYSNQLHASLGSPEQFTLPQILERRGSTVESMQYSNKVPTRIKRNHAHVEGKDFMSHVQGKIIHRNTFAFNYIYYKSKILNIGDHDPYQYLLNNAIFLEKNGFSSSPIDYIITDTYAVHFENFNQDSPDFESRNIKTDDDILIEIADKHEKKKAVNISKIMSSYEQQSKIFNAQEVTSVTTESQSMTSVTTESSQTITISTTPRTLDEARINNDIICFGINCFSKKALAKQKKERELAIINETSSAVTSASTTTYSPPVTYVDSFNTRYIKEPGSGVLKKVHPRTSINKPRSKTRTRRKRNLNAFSPDVNRFLNTQGAVYEPNARYHINSSQPKYFLYFDSAMTDAHLAPAVLRNMDEFNPEGQSRMNDEMLSGRSKREAQEIQAEKNYQDFVKSSDNGILMQKLLDPIDQEAIISRADKHYLIAFDCSTPTSAPTATSSFIENHCDRTAHVDRDDFDVPSTIRKYQILHLENERKIDGWRCSQTLTRTIVQCGWSDYATHFSRESQYAEPQIIKKSVCKHMVDNEQFIDTIGGLHRIKKGTLTKVSYYEAGEEKFSSSDHIDCEGGRVRVDGKIRSSMIVFVTYLISVDKEIIVQREDRSLVAFFTNVRLPCSLADKACIAGTVTFVWPKPESNYYNLKVSRTIDAQIISAHRVDQVLMSTDNSGIRLSLGAKTVICGRTVTSTKYSELYVYCLTDDDGLPKATKFERKLEPDDIKGYHLYITTSQDSLYYEITEQMRKEFAFTKRQECSMRKRLTSIEQYISRTDPNFHTYSFASNTFLTTSGEITYTYKCRPTIVEALNSQYCFDALPVVEITYDNSSKMNFNSQHFGGKANSNAKVDDAKDEIEWPTLYMEPLTHRLSNVANVVPCTAGMYSMYKDILGRWFLLRPEILRVDKPPKRQKVVALAQIDLTNYERKPAHPEGRGVFAYSDMQKMALHLQFPRLRDALITRMASQSAQLQPGAYINPQTLFPSYTLPGGDWTT